MHTAARGVLYVAHGASFFFLGEHRENMTHVHQNNEPTLRSAPPRPWLFSKHAGVSLHFPFSSHVRKKKEKMPRKETKDEIKPSRQVSSAPLVEARARRRKAHLCVLRVSHLLAPLHLNPSAPHDTRAIVPYRRGTFQTETLMWAKFFFPLPDAGGW